MNYSDEFLQLHDSLYAEIDYPADLAHHVEHVAALWKIFCTLDQDIKDQFDFDGDDWDFGYIKKGSAENEDQKEYYHFSKHHGGLLIKHDVTAVADKHPEATEFFAAAEDLYKEVVLFAIAHGEKLALNNPLLETLPEQLARGYNEHKGVIRFLHYTPPVDAEILADPHFDIGGMTFHLHESANGLQFMDWDGSWRDAPVHEGKTELFSGYGLELLTDGIIQRTWHRVIAGENKGVERFSMVLFCDFPDVPGWDSAVRGIARLEPQKYSPKKNLTDD